MKQFKVGVQLYSVRNDLDKNFFGTLRKIRDMGYEYVEFAGYYGHSAEELKDMLDELGLKSISTHSGFEAFETEDSAPFEFLKTIGIKYIVIPWANGDNLPPNAAWTDYLGRVKKVAERAAKYGMEILYHNHDFEFIDAGGEVRYDVMMRDFKGYVNPQPDVCWINYGGYDPAAYIRKYGDRINVVHLKDFNCRNLAAGPVYALIDKDGKAVKPQSQADAGFEFAPLGRGRNDFAKIIKACDEIGAEYLIVEQDGSPDIPTIEAIEISRGYLKDTFGI
ncbi:MAG: sugar phosphate isomerase/epimerase [Clostridia bacterium]|nr:sugar phosphate isomerase/epimerase [Clostridia bacterium]